MAILCDWEGRGTTSSPKFGGLLSALAKFDWGKRLGNWAAPLPAVIFALVLSSSGAHAIGCRERADVPMPWTRLGTVVLRVKKSARRLDPKRGPVRHSIGTIYKYPYQCATHPL